MNNRFAHPNIVLAAVLGLGLSSTSWSQDPIDLSGNLLVNLDAGGIPVGDLHADAVPFTLTDAELGFVFADPKTTLSLDALVINDEGAANVDHAFGTWKPGPTALVFGLAPLAHGLFPARLIHDPLLQRDVETIAPSVGVSHENGKATMHLALASRTARDLDEATGELVESRAIELVPALDVHWGEVGIVRASALLSPDWSDLDLAATIPVRAVLLDVEGVLANGTDAPEDFGFLAGATWSPASPWDLSARFDARRPHVGPWERLLGAGVAYKLLPQLALSAEWIQDLEESEGMATIRLGTNLAWSRPAGAK